MAKRQNDENLSIPEVEKHDIGVEAKAKKYYFDNARVEELMIEYCMGGCIDVDLRDKVMSHASELIRQVIRTHKLDKIYYGKDGTSFSELFMIAWCQIESSLYKFDYSKGHKRIFNLWSQVSRTTMLAHIKKESRHRIKSYNESYKNHLNNRYRYHKVDFHRFMIEAKLLCRSEQNYLKIIDAIEDLLTNDAKPYDGLLYKIIIKTQIPKAVIQTFFEFIRDNGLVFSDSPENQIQKYNYSAMAKHRDDDLEHESD